MQLVQVDAPDIALLVPAPQTMQAIDPAGEYMPATQLVHVLSVVDAMLVEKVPETHFVQLAAPEPIW